MNRLASLLPALVLLLAPIFAALPDDTTLPQTVWASLLSALVIGGALTAVSQSWRDAHPDRSAGDTPALERPGHRALLAFAILSVFAALSVVARLATQHGVAYLDLMLHGWSVLATQFAVFTLCRRLARASRGALYLVVGAAVVGSAVIASIGVNEYLLHFVARETGWRVFATSTPDFLAGYLVVLLPVTLALFLGAPPEKRLPLLFGLVIVLQTATLLTTGSRFALVSLVIAFATSAAGLSYATRRGLTLDAALRRRIIGIAVVLVLVTLGGARPILSRLHSGASQENSGAFRLWTWRGAARMTAANPILGAGVGTWIDTYPRYALTGFTRLAHNSYLQLADECGVPAVLALVTTLGFVGLAGVRGLGHPLAPAPTSAEAPLPMPKAARRASARVTSPVVVASPSSDLLTAVAPDDDRLLLCGLLGSLTAGVVQNLIDSDWYVFFIGVTFWAFAGLTVGLTERPPALPPAAGERSGANPAGGREPFARKGIFARGLALPALRAAGAALMLVFVSQGVAAWFGYQAQTADDPGVARDAYSTARLWDPLGARYPAELGARVEARVGSAATAVSLLRTATRLEPSGTNFRRLGMVLDGAGRHDEAAAAYRAGLRVDPNSLDLLLPLAGDSAPPEALGLYRRVAALEDSPVGRVRAIGEITEARFAIADAALGDAAAVAGDQGEAAHFYGRAQRLLEAYLDEDGTENGERQAQTGNHPDAAMDTQFRDLDARVMDGLAAASPAAQRTALQERAQDKAQRFQAVIDAAGADTATTPAKAVADYERAAAGIEGYVARTQTRGSGDSQAGAQMRGLYKHVLDALTARTPAAGKAAVRAREQSGLRKFAAAFPTP